MSLIYLIQYNVNTIGISFSPLRRGSTSDLEDDNFMSGDVNQHDDMTVSLYTVLETLNITAYTITPYT